MTAEIIYLIPDEDDSFVWCVDPAPGEGQKEEDAIKYLKESFVVEAIKEVFGNSPIATDGMLLVNADRYNKLVDKLSGSNK